MKEIQELNSNELNLDFSNINNTTPDVNSLFKLFVEKSDCWEMLVNAEGKIEYCNDTCTLITGYKPDDFKDFKGLFTELIHEDDKRKTVEVAHEYKVNSLSVEYRIKTNSSRLTWVKHTSKAIFDQNNNYRGRKITIAAIDDFKEREQKLIEAQNRLKLTHSIFYELVSEQSIENVVRSALYQTNIMFPDLRITYADINESGMMQVRYSQNIDDRIDAEGELFDTSLLKMERGKFYRIARPYIVNDINEDELLKPYLDTFAKMQLGSILVMPLQYSKIISGVLCFDSRDAREWNQHEIKTLSNIADFLSLSLKLAMVMAKQKRAERKYREVSTRMMNLMDTLIGGIIFEDIDSRIVHVNKSFCSLFSLDECYKKLPNTKSGRLFDNISELFAESCEFKDFVARIVKARKTVLKKMFRLESGKVVEIDYIPVFLGNEYNGRLWHFRDVSEEVSSKEELEQYANLLKKKTEDLSGVNQKLLASEEELKKTNSEKDKFFSILAHDLRHPFSPILGFTEILIEESKSLTPEEVREYATIIFNSSKNLHRLVENLLQWSRVQSGRISIEPEQFYLFDIVQATLAVYSDSAKNKGIKLGCEVPKTLEIFADQNSIDTVLRNLVSNAIKFTGSGGNICISAVQAGDRVVVRVKDTGVGMKKEHVKRLFKIDRQFTTPGTEKEKGTGLGLILVKEFLELNNSTLTVNSTPGAGTVFEFRLPTVENNTL